MASQTFSVCVGRRLTHFKKRTDLLTSEDRVGLNLISWIVMKTSFLFSPQNNFVFV